MEQELQTPELIEESKLTESQASESTPQEVLNSLLSRRTGEFEIKISHADLKYLKNSIAEKIEWKGPNEAYLTIISILSIENVIQSIDPATKEAIQIKLPASTIESINFFLNRIPGKGLNSAQRLFSLSMMFRPAMESLKRLDEEIEFLKNQIKIDSEKKD